MKKSVIAALALSLMLFAGVASAEVIGIFGDMEGTVCAVDIAVPYTYVDVYFLTLLTDLPALTAVEFGATGVNLAGLTIPTVTWNSPLVIGDLFADGGVSVAFTAPMPGPVVLIGGINYFVLAPVPENTRMQVGPNPGSNKLVVVDEAFQEIDAMGFGLVANCSLADCSCEGVPTDDSTWSEVKSLY